MFPIFFNALTLAASFNISVGVFVHDTKIDKFATMALSLSAPAVNYESGNRIVNIGGDLHTHAEQVSLSQMTRDTPRIQPRGDEKKHLLQKRVMKGHHPFDNYNLPIV